MVTYRCHGETTVGAALKQRTIQITHLELLDQRVLPVEDPVVLLLALPATAPPRRRLRGLAVEGEHRLHLRHVPGPDRVLEEERGLRREGGGLVLQRPDAPEGLRRSFVWASGVMVCQTERIGWLVQCPFRLSLPIHIHASFVT